MARNPLTPFRFGGPLGGELFLSPFLSLLREMNRPIDDVLRRTSLFQGSPQGGEAILFALCMNVSEKDIQIDLNDDMLVIRGEKKLERKNGKENFHLVERFYGTFQRSL